eukprot:c39422_g1_i1 orf=70-231(+)
MAPLNWINVHIFLENVGILPIYPPCPPPKESVHSPCKPYHLSRVCASYVASQS